jgi:nucleoside-diphosphate kinase
LLEWCDSIEVVRKIVWPTEPKSAPPWTIRWDYAHLSFKYADETWIILENLVHASANKEEAAQEIALWFKEEELFN